MKPYQYKGAGLDNVYLSNGYTEVKYGKETATSVMNVEGLHKAIAAHLIYHTSKLGGKEVRFLRNEIDMSQNALAELLDINVQTVANWEKGVHKINGSAERLLRLYAGECLLKHRGKIGKLLGEFAKITNHIEERMFLKKTKDGWQEKIAA